jgi:diguanylate cyclase (GGDEF)-like protein/PAS domain S-box-containing protein
VAAVPAVVEVLAAAAAQMKTPLLALTADDAGHAVVRWVNDAAADLFRLGMDDLVGRRICTGSSEGPAAAPDWTDLVASALVVAGGLPVPKPAGLTRPDSSTVRVQVRVLPADRALQGGVAGWLVLLDPVSSAEQQAEQAGHESEHRFHALAEHAPVGIVLSEVGVRLGFVNDRFAELTGMGASDFLGSRWLDVIHPEDLPTLLDTLYTVLEGATAEQTVRIQSVADTPRWCHFRLAPVTSSRRAAGFIATVEDITARRAWEAQLAYQASHDPLTGLANRRTLLDTLSDLLDGGREQDRQFAVLFADLDGFKQVNDTLGHHAGDLVLVEIGRCLRAMARENDQVARIAGDEFVIILRQVRDGHEAEAAAARYLAGLTTPIRIGKQDLPVSASIGVALPLDGDTPESLLRAADRSMYQAKNSGPGRHHRDANRHQEPGHRT